MLTPRQRGILKNRIAGCVYGFAIGDAMGATTEFMTSTQIQSQFGVLKQIVGGGWLNLEKGQVTDDTQMSMCIMRVLQNIDSLDPAFGYEFKVDCTKEFIDWLDTGPTDVGKQCSKALLFSKNNRSYIGYTEWIPEDIEALGNGSLMRSMPCAILNLQGFNHVQSDITHPNNTVRDIVQKYSEVIWGLISGFMSNYTISDMMGPQMSSDYLKPSGHVVNTWNNALLWADKPSFMDCLIGAVNDGGDADTIAAIACSMSGARFGLSSIDAKLISSLDKKLMPELGSFINFAVYEVEKKLS